MSSRVTALLITAIAVVLIVWLFRYTLVSFPAGGEGVHGAVYRLDRWMGEVKWFRERESGTPKDQR